MATHKVSWIIKTVGVLLAVFVPASAQFIPAPSPPFPFPVGNSPASVVVGNFNADSLPDLAIANRLDGTVTLILSNGTGGYTAGGPFQVGKNPSSLVVGDFDKDGNQDLAIANQGDNTVTVLLGNGTGGFKSPFGLFPVGKSPSSVAVGDFNGDGYPDLAIANRDSNNVTVLKGDGTGGFSPFPNSPFPVGNSPSSIAVGDFNGDGNLDLAITNELDNTVTVLLGDGTGGFKPAIASPFAVGGNPAFVVVGDFNGDGNLDLAVANLDSKNVTVLLGNGTGWFKAAPTSPFAVGSEPVSMAVGDFNGDSIPDLAIANSGSNNVTVLLGDGTGGFKASPGSPFAVGSNPMSVCVGDFNADGLPDLAVANSKDNNVSVLLNTITTSPVMVSAASYSPKALVAPGSIVSIFGIGLSSLPPLGATSTSPPQLPTCLNWITATINDSSGVKNLPLSLYYVGPTQINAQIPQTAATGAATFAISPSASTTCSGPQGNSSQTSASQKGSVTLAAVAPGLFSANNSGMGVAAGQFVSDLGLGTAIPVATCPAVGPCTANPLDVSSGTSILALYGTGIHNRVNLSDVTVTIGAQTLPAFYAGPAADFPGLDQVNVSLPKTLVGSGTVFVTVSIAGVVSNQVTVYIQ